MTIKVGILGFAHNHVNVYCNQWRDRPELDMAVVAGWDHDAARLEQNASTYGFQAYADSGALLKQAGVDAVVVSAETSHHADLVEQAAAAGKAIMLQKPMALTLDQADRIVAAVNQHGVPFTLAWQMRVDPQNVQIKELIHGGQLGKLFMVRRRHGLNTHEWPNFNTLWHAKPELNRDMWADDSSHAIDIIHWVLGVPESVSAEIVSLFDPLVPNDNGIAIFRYPGGPLAEVVCSFTCPAAENSVEVIAEKGSIILNYGDVPSVTVPRPADAPGLKWYLSAAKQWTFSEIPSPPNQWARISALAAPLADFLHGKREPLATAEEGRTTLRMTLACYISTREGRRVRIDDPTVQHV
jgi:predicted dehydrogenase